MSYGARREGAGNGRGRQALVTGASSGIGAAFAQRLARDGHHLHLVARRAERLEQLAEAAKGQGVEARVLPTDLADPSQLQRLVDAVGEAPVDVLVHAAGFGTRGLYHEIDEATTLAMIDVHVVAAARLVRACLPGMLDRGRGAIVIVSSLASLWPARRYATYSATKSYLNMLASCLHEELRGTGVSVQALCAGLTETEFLDTAEYAEFKYQGVPKRYWMTPEQVVDESLAALGNGKPHFVPGKGNRAFVAAMNGPFGPAVQTAVGLAARLGERVTGKPVY